MRRRFLLSLLLLLGLLVVPPSHAAPPASDLNAWEANKFETDANLYWSGYSGPYGGTRDCY